ncbi:T-cell receptor gamma chain V region PT-gamma-1/2 [Tupaia chinensis]|nr:T-cell receptor gamma chain V region PT-gamma-1/2 [Tupaia chinensis]
MTVAGRTGSTAEITCDLQVSASYIHWYQFQEGKAPRRLLIFMLSNSRSVVDTGISRAKYQAFKRVENNYGLLLKNLDKSDSAVYSCAIWTGTVIRTCLVLH